MPGTTTAGLPYPVAGDPLADYPPSAQKVAEAVPAIAGGTVNVALSNVAQAFTTVTFPAGRFTTTPKVTLATSTDAAYLGLAAVPSATSMRAYAKRLDGTAVTATIAVSWLAANGGPIT